MQKIEGTTIKVNRGDVLSFSLSLENEDETPYTFQEGDKIIFSIYNKKALNEKAVLIKEVEATSGETSISINCTKEDMTIGALINKEVEYWYEIELNGEHTIIGYDDTGAKILMLYPEGSKIQ